MTLTFKSKDQFDWQLNLDERQIFIYEEVIVKGIFLWKPLGD